MSNQRLTNGYAAWLAWWETNKHKTQVEWIRDGFARQGIILHQPLATNDIVVLLKLIDSTKHNYLRYNAQRWLRDSNFRPYELQLDDMPAEERNELAKGLVSYAYWVGLHWNDPGHLQIDENTIDNSWSHEPMIERAPFNLTLITLLVAMAFSGFFLLRR